MSSSQRFEQLDSLRGLAALTVIFGHLTNIFRVDHGPYAPIGAWLDRLDFTPLYLLFSAHEAVVLFFVLSGFVLYLPFRQGRALPYNVYVIRRVCRIYLPFIAAVLVALIVHAMTYQGTLPAFGRWLNDPGQHISAVTVAGHVGMIGVYDTTAIIPVIWSLVHEMRVSLYYPALAGFVAKRTTWLLIGAALACFALGLALHAAVYMTTRHAVDVTDTVKYTGCFIIGALLAKQQTRVVSWLQRVGRFGRAFVILAAVMTYGGAHLLPGKVKLIAGDVVVTVGAALLVALSLASPSWQRVLTRPVALWLGRVSYSTYLLHAIVILGVFHAGHARLPAWALVVASVMLTLAVSEIFHRWVEVPSMALGRRWSKQVMPSTAGD